MLEQMKEEIIKDYLGGQSTNKLAEKYQSSAGSIHRLLTKNGIEIRNKHTSKKILDHTTPSILHMFDNGYTIGEIAKETKINDSTVTRILKKNNKDTQKHSLQIKHELLVVNEKYILDSFRQGQTCDKLGKEFNCSYQTIAKFLHDRNIATPLNTYDVNLDFFKNIDSEEKAWVLGWVITDGNVDKCVRIEIKIDDIDALEKIKKVIEYTGPIKIVTKKDKQYCSLRISRVEIGNDLNKLGITNNKSFIVGFPDIPEHLYNHFMRSCIEGDGSLFTCNNQKRVKLIGSHDFIKKSTEICSIFGARMCKGHTYKYIDDPYQCMWEMIIANQEGVKNFLDWLYKDATIYLNRKYQKYLQFYSDSV